MSVPANNDEPLVRIAEGDFAKAVSLRAILAASLPSIVNNAAQPIAAALQLGLLGHSDSAAQRVAVFSAVGAAVTFVANISNFVIVVTMSRVGTALGAQQWKLLGRMVRAVLLTAVPSMVAMPASAPRENPRDAGGFAGPRGQPGGDGAGLARVCRAAEADRA